jgi:hypothetical protein
LTDGGNAAVDRVYGAGHVGEAADRIATAAMSSATDALIRRAGRDDSPKLERRFHHLGLERAERRVDRDLRREPLGQVPGELMHGLRRQWAYVSSRGTWMPSINRCDGAPDRRPWPRLRAAGAGTCEVEHTTLRSSTRSRRVVVVVERCAPGCTRVVDEDVNPVFATADLFRQPAAFGFGREIGRDADALAVLRERALGLGDHVRLA